MPNNLSRWERRSCSSEGFLKGCILSLCVVGFCCLSVISESTDEADAD